MPPGGLGQFLKQGVDAAPQQTGYPVVVEAQSQATIAVVPPEELVAAEAARTRARAAAARSADALDLAVRGRP